MSVHRGFLGVSAAVLFCCWIAALDAAEPDAATLSAVRSLLKTKCLVCHGDDAKDLKGSLDLRTRATALKGGESGEAAIVPGHPERSPLYISVTRPADGLQMPPKENDRLDPKQIELIKQWIAAGAPWPREEDEGLGLRAEGQKGDGWSNADGVKVELPAEAFLRNGRTASTSLRICGPINPSAAQTVPTDVIDPARIAKSHRCFSAGCDEAARHHAPRRSRRPAHMAAAGDV